MINTQLLKDAASTAKTKEEKLLCRNLANSISDGCHYAWKMFYSGEASSLLSRDSFKALEKLMKTAEEVFNTPPCKYPKPKPTTRVYVQLTKGKGVKISEPNTEEKGEKLMPTPMTRPLIVCGLRALDSNESYAPKRKGKEKVYEVKVEIDGDSDEDQGLPWERMYIREPEFAKGEKCHDMFCDDADGKLRLFKVYEDYEEHYDDDGPEIPLSPYREADELDPDYHAFLVLRKGTQRSP